MSDTQEIRCWKCPHQQFTIYTDPKPPFETHSGYQCRLQKIEGVTPRAPVYNPGGCPLDGMRVEEATT